MPEPNSATGQDVATTETDTESDYIETIKNLKENTVSKSDYEKLRAEHKKLLTDYINNNQPEQPTIVVDPAEVVKKLREELYPTNGEIDESMTNLDYWKKVIQLRQNEIDRGRADPSLPMKGSTGDDEELSDKIVDVVQQCIDQCHDDPAVFRALFESRTR